MSNHRAQLLRAILATVDDSGSQQLMKLTGLAGQTIGEAVRSQPFGLTSVPPAGAEALILAIGGGMDRAHALGVEHPQHRPTGNPAGSTVLYDANGNAVSLVQSNIRIVSPGTVTITAPTIVLNGSVTLGGPAGSGVAAAMQGTVDTGGNADVSNLATKVKVN
jgi:phage baseplate assembly protein V